MNTLLQDLRYGARMLAKKPGFTLVAVLTIALGIGASTAIFSAVETIFLRPLPFGGAERLIYLSSSFPGNTRGGDNFSIPDFRDVAARNRSFESVAAYQDWVAVALTGADEPVRVTANFVSDAWFGMLGARAQLGRTFTAEENRLTDGQPVVVLSHAFWQRQFGGVSGIIGKQIHLNENPLTMIGVMDPDFRDLEETWRPAVDVWLPMGQSDPLLVSLLPALESSRVNLRDSLSQAGRQGGSLSRNPRRKALIVAEVALSLILMIGAGLTLKSFRNLVSTGIGFPTKDLLTLRMDLTSRRYAQPADRARFARQLVERAATMTGVESAALWGPGDPGLATWVIFAAPEGRPAQRQEDFLMVHRHNSNPNALRTFGIPLLRGRDFSWLDTADTPRVAIISDSMARKLWPNEEAVGKRFLWQAANAMLAVIGVARDATHRRRFHPEFGAQAFGPQYDVYLPYSQSPHPRLVLALRSKADPAGMVAALRRTVSSLDPNLPVYDIKTLDERLRAQEAPNRAVATLLGVYAGLALLLAMLGLYGVVAYSVSQRTNEIGIRIAIGARGLDILKLVIGEGMKLILAGAVVGLTGAFAVTRLLSGLLFGVSATDPRIFTVFSLLLALVALIACWVPARRAARVDPMVALRHD